MKIDCIYLWITLIIHDMTTDKHQKDEKAAIQQHSNKKTKYQDIETTTRRLKIRFQVHFISAKIQIFITFSFQSNIHFGIFRIDASSI